MCSGTGLFHRQQLLLPLAGVITPVWFFNAQPHSNKLNYYNIFQVLNAL